MLDGRCGLRRLPRHDLNSICTQFNKEVIEAEKYTLQQAAMFSSLLARQPG